MFGSTGLGRLAAAWWQEIVSFLFVVVFFVAITIILAKYNGQEQPDWKYSLNLSTLVALMSTLLRASLVVVVEGIVSQLKWLWYKTSRPLRHMSHFDQAARSPWGSLLLPFRIKRVNSAFLGALIAVLSLAIGPSTQQAIKNFSCRKVLSTNVSFARMPIAHQVTTDPSAKYIDLHAGIRGAIFNGLTDPSGKLSTVSPICGSGNCTFADYASAALCGKCAEVTSLINEVLFTEGNGPLYSNVTLPNGLSIGDGPSGKPGQWLNISMNQSLDWAQISDDVMLAGLPASIYNSTLLQVTDANCTITINPTDSFGKVSYNYDCPQHGKVFSSGWRNFGFQATSCIPFPCAKTYRSEIINGALDEEVYGQIPLLPKLPKFVADVQNQFAFNSPCIIAGERYDLGNVSQISGQHQNINTTIVEGKNVTVPSECFYSVGGTWIYSLYDFLRSTLIGSCFLSGDLDLSLKTRATVQCFKSQDSYPLSSSWWLQALYNNGNATFDGLESSIDAIATAITNKIRTIGTNWDGSQDFATGSSTRTTICTQVNWPWLILPEVLFALTLFLLIAITLRTTFGDVPVWKSSLLPLVFASRDSFTTKSGNLGDIEDAADDIFVKLKRTGDDWTLARSSEAISSGIDLDDQVGRDHRHSRTGSRSSTSLIV